MSKQSSTTSRPESTADERREKIHDARYRRGFSPRAERRVMIGAAALMLVLAIGWTWSIASAQSRSEVPGGVTTTGASITTALTKKDAPTTAYVTDASLDAITRRMLATARGTSGKLKADIQPTPGAVKPDTLPPGGKLQYEKGGEVVAEPRGAGIWRVLLNVGDAVRPVSSFNVISMLPFSAKKNGKVGLYYIGNWPSERGAVGPKKAPYGAYANPAGFIEVTKENKDTPVSEHFQLRDFLTHDQPNVWPKYLVLQEKLIDKLELVMSDLQAHGINTKGVTVMSGFRTPQYNVGGGSTGGRAGLSRHMYGDASDIFIDNNGDGQMDDLNHDGRVNINDSRVILAAVDRVEAAHPELIGGAGVYTAAQGHGPFIHIDTRGYRARWMGTSGG